MYELRITDPYTPCCQITNLTEHYITSININKTNVSADLYELLSVAKNLPELNIRTESQRS